MRGQIADRNQEEYKQLAWDLASLAQSLQTRLSQSEPTHMPFSIENVARYGYWPPRIDRTTEMVFRAISEQARRIQLQQDRLGTRRFAAAREDEEDILECYRRVAALFNQLQVGPLSKKSNMMPDYEPDGHFALHLGRCPGAADGMLADRSLHSGLN